MAQPFSGLTFQQELILVIVQGLLIGMFILLTGYFLNRQLEKYRGQQEWRRAEARLRDETSLRYLESQIGELYGPLFGMQQTGEAMYHVFQKRMANAKTDNERAGIRHFYFGHYFLPLNRQMVDLIRSRSYLLTTEQFPGSFGDFMQHQAQFESIYMLGVEGGISSDAAYHPLPYPSEFNADVRRTLDELQKKYRERQHRLHG